MITNVVMYRESSHDEAAGRFCISTLPHHPFQLSLKKSVAEGASCVIFTVTSVAGQNLVVYEHLVPGFARDCRVLLQQALAAVTEAFVTDVLEPVCRILKEAAGITINREVLCADPFREPPSFSVQPDARGEQRQLNRLCFHDATA